MKKIIFALTLIVLLALTGNIEAKEISDVDRILESAGTTHGICAFVGAGKSALPIRIADSSDFLVHVLDPSEQIVADIKKEAGDAGLYVKRVIAEKLISSQLPYANNMVDVLVTGLRDVEIAEIKRVLRPGGALVVLTEDKSGKLSSKMVRIEKRLDSSLTRNFGLPLVWTKPPIEGADSWTHWNYGPDNNPLSADSVIRAPYRTQWMGAPLYTAMPTVTTIAGGRVFLAMGNIAHHEREEEWLNTLVARNGYNGAILWTRKLPVGYFVHRSAFIASEDVFYMMDDGKCRMLDPETGAEIGEIKVPGAEDQWKWMAMQDGVLYVLSGTDPDNVKFSIVKRVGGGWSWGNMSQGYYRKPVSWGFGSTLTAYDIEKKKTIWKHEEEGAIDSRGMTMGYGNIFFYARNSRIACLDAVTGKPKWSNADSKVLSLIEEMPGDSGKKLVSTPGFRSHTFSMCTPDALLFEAQTRMNVVSLSTKDGSLLWSKPKTTNNPNLLYADGSVIVGIAKKSGQEKAWLGVTVALDPVTGEEVKSLDFSKAACARLTGSPDAFYVRGEGLRRYDRKTGTSTVNQAVRPGCNDGAMPANGLLYVGPWLCDCNLQLIGTVTMCSADDVLAGPALESERPAKSANKIAKAKTVSDKDWRTYRGNDDRSASSPAEIPAKISKRWSYSASENLRACVPTTAAGLVFVCGDDGRVRAIDADSGKDAWSFQANGAIRASATLSEGRVYVGSTDGYVYALDMATGKELWRFHVAPTERKLMLYGDLSSNWPVNSGVMVADGTAYATAGIIDYDGTYVCALDAESGKLAWENSTSGELKERLSRGVSAQGYLTLANGKMWTAGGHMVAPAAYDLKTGEYVGAIPQNERARSTRGEEVGIFDDKFVIFGGRLQYSGTRNVADKASFNVKRTEANDRLKDRFTFVSGRVAPAWNDEVFVMVQGRNKPIVCNDADKMSAFFTEQTSVEMLKKGANRGGRGRKAPKASWPKTLWGANVKQEGGFEIDTVSLAVSKNAVVAVSVILKWEGRREWFVQAFDIKDGTEMWKQALPSEAMPGGLSIDSDGQVLVALDNGTLICFG